MDIYKQHINKKPSDKQLVNTGRLTAGIALVIACIMAPLLGGIDQAFQFIQEYTGIVSPGILAVFMLGLFWKKTNNQGAIWGAIISVPIAIGFKFVPDMPWMNQMGLTALLTMGFIMAISMITGKGANDEKGISMDGDLFKTGPVFNISAFAIMIITAVLYALFW
jgi:SSS family solute:Na+ symporter